MVDRIEQYTANTVFCVRRGDPDYPFGRTRHVEGGLNNSANEVKDFADKSIRRSQGSL